MIINDYIKDFLVNYWDCNGSLDGLSKTSKRIYQLILDRRKKENSKIPVNDYIYSKLGVSAKGRLGEEITYELNNHVLAYKSLKNIKDCPIYSKLNKLSNTLNTSIIELLKEAGYEAFLETEPVNLSYSNLNVYYIINANLLKTILQNASYEVNNTLDNYYVTNKSFYNLQKDLPQLYENLSRLFNIEICDYYTEALTNADAMLTFNKFYFKESEDKIPSNIAKSTLIQELLYLKYGYVPNKVLTPSLRFAVHSHLHYYKTLYNMYKVNPRLYASLKAVYLIEGKYKSLADMLEKEGFYYPKLTVENNQYLPCQDKEHLVYVSGNNSTHILLNKKTLSYLFEHGLESQIITATHNDTIYAACPNKRGSKVEYVPFHLLYTACVDTIYLDGNLLNISSDNLLVPTL